MYGIYMYVELVSERVVQLSRHHQDYSIESYHHDDHDHHKSFLVKTQRR